MNKKHIFFYTLLRPLVILFLKTRFKFRYQKASELPENYIVLSNHTTDYDMLMVASSFPRQMYFVGSEHISRWGFLSKLIMFAFDPIMRPKGTVAASTVIEVMRRVKKGANVCIFAEGVRSWDGTSSPILPSTAKLIKKSGCGLVTYKITGGYFASPMWGGASTRKGPVYSAPVRVFTKEQIKSMTTDEIYSVIVEDLWEDAYQRQLADPKPYHSKAPAEHLEKLLFLCPTCGKRDTFRSQGDKVTCHSCGLTFRCDEYGMLHDLPFRTVKELSDWQKEQIKSDVLSGETYTAAGGVLSTVNGQEEIIAAQGPVSLSREFFRCGEYTLPTDQISDLAMHGQKAVVFSANNDYYELVIEEHSNALKFFLYYITCNSLTKETVSSS